MGDLLHRSSEYFPVRSVGEHEFGWYLLDYNDDHIAEGTDPRIGILTVIEWSIGLEVNDDEQDGSQAKLHQSGTIHANNIGDRYQTLDNPSMTALTT